MAVPVVAIVGAGQAGFQVAASLQQDGFAGRIVLIGGKHAAEEASLTIEHFLEMPEMGANFAPIVHAIPLQMLAYHTAVSMGKDADQPRNLAKSVTVE